MDVLLIGGSLRRPSHTGAVLREVALQIERSGASPTLWDVHERPLPLADPRFGEDDGRHPSAAVRALRDLATRAQAFVIVSPVYHNSYSGAVKNVLDHLSIAHFRRKPVALASHGSPRSTVQACDHLRIVVRGLHGVGTVCQLATVDEDFKWGQDGYEIAEPAVARRLKEMVDELLLIARLLALGRSRTMTRALAAAIGSINGGGDGAAQTGHHRSPGTSRKAE